MPTHQRRLLLTCALCTALATNVVTQSRPDAPARVRLYILDCGTITGVAPAQVGFKEGEIATTAMITPCYLIAHPRGTLMWEVGQLPDAVFKGNGTPAKQGFFTVTKPLLPQLATLGYKPSDVTYLALSHFHNDHSANANAFAGSTWIVQQAERDAMFARHDPGEKGLHVANLAYVGNLEKSKTIVVKNTDHDVFGDGTVILKFTPGHTPGHQSIFLKLANSGPVVLSGDLYHYPEELARKFILPTEADPALTAKSRAMLEAFVKATGAQLWIQHDSLAAAHLKKAPDYYD